MMDKIIIPKGKYCGKCKFLHSDFYMKCALFNMNLGGLGLSNNYYKTDECLKMFPRGAHFIRDKKQKRG